MTKPSLLDVVDAFIAPQRIRLWREDTKRGEWQDIPSLWAQLEESAGRGNGSGGGTSRAGQPVISTGVVALLIKITTATTAAAVDLVGGTRGNVPDNLRAITANLRTAGQAQFWIDEIQAWTAEARNRLQLDPPHAKSARGAACPECKAKVSYSHVDGENVRRPALSIHWVGPQDNDHHSDEDWKVRAVECTKCGKAWFRGEGLDELIVQMLTANTTLETMTDAVVPTRRRTRRRLG